MGKLYSENCEICLKAEIKRLQMSKTKLLEVLQMIIDDCEADVKEFDGKEFSGKTLGELHGILEAKIQALAKIVKTLIKEN